MGGGLQRNVFYFTHGTRTIADHYLLLVNAKQRSEELTREVAELQSKVAALQEVGKENDRLRASLDFKKLEGVKLVSAHVVGHDVSNDYVGIRIDKGTRDGLREGLGVVSPQGVVGRILRTSDAFSTVITVIDPTSNIDGVIQRSRTRGIVSGQLNSMKVRMRYVDRLEDVVAGDTVVSSGFGWVFPAGLLIGYVMDVIPSPNSIVQSVIVKPAVDIYRLEEVLIAFPPAESKAVS
ncbi:MAG: rod shape-determining protein MreC [Deltaproteobacteria bacterium]|nr:rod shape-determining protein MreC [Deltaproteobacteria bacterium]